MRDNGGDGQRHQRDDHVHAEKQQAVGLNSRKRRGPVGKPDGRNESAKPDVAQRLLRGRGEASDGGAARPAASRIPTPRAKRRRPVSPAPSKRPI